MTVAVYAGSFDPFTYGHLSVVKQACRLFSHVRILVAENPDKDHMFSSRERMKLIESYISGMPQVSVDFTPNYVVDYAERIGATVLVRGVRNETDAKAELHLFVENNKLKPQIQTVLLPSDPSVSNISSTGAKDFVRRSQNYEDVSHFITREVYSALRTQLTSRTI